MKPTVSGIGFYLLNTKILARPRSGFYVHKECRAAEIWILSTQRIPRGRGPILFTHTILFTHRYRLVWQSTLTRKQKVDRYLSLVVAKAVWCVHQLTLLPADFAYLEYVHARCLRRILNRKAAFISRISNSDIRRAAAAPTMTSLIRQRQFIRLGKLRRRQEDHPDRLACFEPGSDLQPRIPNGTHRRRGRPRTVWAETLLPLCEQQWNATRAEILQLAKNKRDWQQRTERLSRSL